MAEYGEFERLATGEDFCTWLPPEARARLLNALDEIHPAEPTFRLEFEALTAKAQQWFEFSGVRIPGRDGRAERVTGVVREITEQKTAFTRLAYLANYDELTGQLNRTRLQEELSRVLQSATSQERHCAYAVASIDKLAVINEIYGFDVADELIVQTGNRLAQALRLSDVIGRTAGNKFGVVLGECGEREMSMVADRLHTAVRSEPIQTAPARFPQPSPSARSGCRRVRPRARKPCFAPKRRSNAPRRWAATASPYIPVPHSAKRSAAVWSIWATKLSLHSTSSA
jgi:diguanylate cyclase (GGDEF)-like protein